MRARARRADRRDVRAGAEARAARLLYAGQARGEHIVLDAISNQGLQAVIVPPGQIFGRGSEKFAPAGTMRLQTMDCGGRRACACPSCTSRNVVDALLLAATRDHVCGSTFHVIDSVDVLTQNDTSTPAAASSARRCACRTFRPVLMAVGDRGRPWSLASPGVALPLVAVSSRFEPSAGPFEWPRAKRSWGGRRASARARGLDAAAEPAAGRERRSGGVLRAGERKGTERRTNVCAS